MWHKCHNQINVYRWIFDEFKSTLKHPNPEFWWSVESAIKVRLLSFTFTIAFVSFLLVSSCNDMLKILEILIFANATLLFWWLLLKPLLTVKKVDYNEPFLNVMEIELFTSLFKVLACKCQKQNSLWLNRSLNSNQFWNPLWIWNI